MLDDKEQRLLDLLATPLPPLSHSHPDHHETMHSDENKGMSMVSIPPSHHTHGHEHGQGVGVCVTGDGNGKRETRNRIRPRTGAAPAATTTAALVSAPAVHDTFEVPIAWGDDDSDEDLLPVNKTGTLCNAIDGVGSPHRGKHDSSGGLLLGMGLRLFQYAPGPREGVLQFRQELKRSVCTTWLQLCLSSASPMS